MTKCHLSAAICSVNWSRWFAHQVGRTLKHWERSPLKFYCHLNESVSFCFEKATQAKCSNQFNTHIWTGSSEGVFLWSEVTCCEADSDKLFLNTKGRPVTHRIWMTGKIGLCSYSSWRVLFLHTWFVRSCLFCFKPLPGSLRYIVQQHLDLLHAQVAGKGLEVATPRSPWRFIP